MPTKNTSTVTSGSPADTATVTKRDTDRLTEVRRKIALQTAPAWLPEEGAILTGAVEMVKRGESEYGAYPIVVLSVQSIDPNPDGVVGGSFVAIHAFHSLLQDELLKIRPVTGDVLTFAYMGQQETNESKRSYAAAVLQASGDATKIAKAEQDRTFYHLYVLMTGDGTTADAVKVEEFNWDTDTKNTASVE
jgi:hypothetical protein